MPVESEADRASFLNSDEFGDGATYTPVTGSPATFTGIFDAPHTAIDIGEISVSDRRPTFLCRASDVPAGAKGGNAGDTLLVDGTTYRVIDLEPDGQGMTRIVLGANS